MIAHLLPCEPRRPRETHLHPPPPLLWETEDGDWAGNRGSLDAPWPFILSGTTGRRSVGVQAGRLVSSPCLCHSPFFPHPGPEGDAGWSHPWQVGESARYMSAVGEYGKGESCRDAGIDGGGKRTGQARPACSGTRATHTSHFYGWGGAGGSAFCFHRGAAVKCRAEGSVPVGIVIDTFATHLSIFDEEQASWMYKWNIMVLSVKI